MNINILEKEFPRVAQIVDSPTLGFQMATFSLHPHVAEREKASSLSSHKGMSPILGFYSHDLIQKPHLLRPSHWVLVSIRELGSQGRHIQSLARS